MSNTTFSFPSSTIKPTTIDVEQEKVVEVEQVVQQKAIEDPSTIKKKGMDVDERSGKETSIEKAMGGW